MHIRYRISDELKVKEYDEKAVKRLLSKRIITESGCWIFNGCRNSDGYGNLGYKGKMIGAHILAFKLFRKEEYKDFYHVLHTCDVRACFNPEHLFQGTDQDNVRDCVKKGRQACIKKTQCPSGHMYSVENTYVNPNTKRRHCKECKRIYDRMPWNSKLSSI